ncbi:hypothetical protein Tco_1420836 [Tanacetum coccineum]
MELHVVSYGIDSVARPLLLFFSSENQLLWFRYREYDLAHLKLIFEFSIYKVWKSVRYGVSKDWIRRIGDFLEHGYAVSSLMDTIYHTLSFSKIRISLFKMVSSHNQAIADVGSENRPPMLEKGNGPYKMKEITDQGNPDGNPPVLPFQRIQKDAYLKGDEKKWFEADIDAMNAILFGIQNDIYNSELTSRLLDEFDKFKRMSGESIESYYSRFSKIMNDLERHGCLPQAIASNTKLLSSWKPKWDKYVTMVCQAKNLLEVDYDQLYDYLKQNEKNVNASRAKRAATTHDPLALVANHYVTPFSSHTRSPYYVTYPPSVSDFDAETQSFEFQGDATNDDLTDNLTTTMMLLAKEFTQHYSIPTNNRKVDGNLGNADLVNKLMETMQQCNEF